jgi:hypothetical protein
MLIPRKKRIRFFSRTAENLAVIWKLFFVNVQKTDSKKFYSLKKLFHFRLGHHSFQSSLTSSSTIRMFYVYANICSTHSTEENFLALQSILTKRAQLFEFIKTEQVRQTG